MKVLTKIYRLLSSSRLAIGLLVVILACCLAGVTLVRGKQAWLSIFSTFWFNGLLTLLVVNTAVCFFGRMWRKKLTLTFLGMILFHLSFVAIFCGIVYDSLLSFDGTMRLTEGEVLPNDQLSSYDAVRTGRFFEPSSLRGTTTLVRMHKEYKVDGQALSAVYEVSVDDDGSNMRGVIYPTHGFSFGGTSYYNDKEGYSLLLLLFDPQGRELHGAHVPLQSLPDKDQARYYVHGSMYGPETLAFPEKPHKPALFVRLEYQPDPALERSGTVVYSVWDHPDQDSEKGLKPKYRGSRPVGQKFPVGLYQLAVVEVRYWVGMTVKHHPGHVIVLTSLWVALAGMVLTFWGRLTRRSRMHRDADAGPAEASH